MKQETIYLKLEVVSPVHVGCGEVYEPTCFVIDEKKKILLHFDPFAFLKTLETGELKKFSTICSEGTVKSLLEIYQFMRKYQNRLEGNKVKVCSGLVSHYQKTLDLSVDDLRKINQELNRFEIKRTSFSPFTGLPVIPGSALKGAVRTAVLNLRNSKEPIREKMKDNEASKLEKELLCGTFNRDPFRLIKFSDFHPSAQVNTRIVYGVHRKKQPTSRESSIPQIFEVIESGSIFYGSLNITVPSKDAEIKKPITFEEIKEALAHFFLGEAEREKREMKVLEIPYKVPYPEADSLLLRIGHHSGAECVTIRGHRRIKISPPKVRPIKFSETGATTFWFSSDQKSGTANEFLRPFGWIIVKQISKDEARSLADSERQALKSLEQVRMAARQEREKAGLEREQLERKIAAEKERKREEEKKIQAAQWEAMSEEDRDIAIIRGDELAKLNQPNVNLYGDGGIWSKIDSAAPGHKQALAKAFMELWQKEGKWNVKKKQKKQYANVQKVKEILGLE